MSLRYNYHIAVAIEHPAFLLRVSSKLVLLSKFRIILKRKKMNKNSSDIIDINLNCVLFCTFLFNFYMQNNE